MTPLFATCWDGTHAFVRWDPATHGRGLRVRYRAPGRDWRPWIEVGRPWPLRGGRLKIPTHRMGEAMEAELISNDHSPFWHPAALANFCKVRVRFLFAAEMDLTLPASLPFTAMVRHEMASFRLLDGLTLAAGEHREVEMESCQASPFNELDVPGEFTCAPLPGLTLANLAASGSAFSLCGLETSGVISVLPPSGPLSVHFGAAVVVP